MGGAGCGWEGRMAGGNSAAAGEEHSPTPPLTGSTATREPDGPVCNKPWTTEKLQKYLSYVRDTFTSVRLTRDAEVSND